MKPMSRLIFSGCMLLALLVATALPQAFVMRPVLAAVNAVRYVSPAGVYTGDCISTPCASINFAVGRAVAGDVISIAAGTYVENIQIPKTLTVQGAGRGVTIVDGNNIGPVFYIYGSGTNVTLTGLTIQNGSATTGIYQFGGGVYYESSGQLTVSSVDVLTNTAVGGGGIFAQGQLILNSIRMVNNSAGSQGGGGLRVNNRADLTNVTIANNSASLGGGIYNQGTTNLTNVTIAGNTADSGGGLYNEGDLQSASGIVTGAGGVIQNNQAASSGGGIYNTTAGKVQLTNATVQGNTATNANGGGIYNTSAGQIQLSNVTVQGNTATTANGGGIYNTNDGQIQLSNMTVQNNTANANGGGIFNQATANVTRIVLSGNRAQGGGGGVFNNINGQFTLNRAWLKDNIAVSAAGGGISNEGVLVLTTSTLSGNTATILQGGGLRNKGTATLTLVTISGNLTPSSQDGGGVYSSDGGSVQITSSTIISNTDPGLTAVTGGTISLVNSIVAHRGGGPNCSGAITSLGFNLETKNTCNFTQVSDLKDKNPPGLGPLKNNGGLTPTHAPAFWSPATNNGTTNLAACQAFDQRGVTRPQPQGGRCDIGSYETIVVQNTTIVTVPPHLCAQSFLSITGSYKINKLNIGLNATLNPRRDFRVTLISPAPAFKRVTLLGPTGGTAVNLDALFDDAAPGPVPGSGIDNIAPPYYENVYKPYGPLSALNGISVAGLWTLETCSEEATSGSINSWLFLVPEVTTNFIAYLPVFRR